MVFVYSVRCILVVVVVFGVSLLCVSCCIFWVVFVYFWRVFLVCLRICHTQRERDEYKAAGKMLVMLMQCNNGKRSPRRRFRSLNMVYWCVCF